MSVELVMLSNHLVLCHPLLLLPSVFPGIRVFSNESALPISGQSIGASASAPVISAMNIHSSFPLGLTGLTSLQFRGPSRIFSSTIQKHQFYCFSAFWLRSSAKASILWLSHAMLIHSIWHMCTAMCKTDSGNLLYSTRSSAQCSVTT